MKFPRFNNIIAPLIVIVAGILTLVGVFIFQIVSNPLITRPIVLIPSEPIDNPRISVEKAKTLFDQNLVIFLDVRSTLNYDQAHIPGAINIPLAFLESRINELNPNKWIITYCT
jgi:hypothetical protein